jgi:hypothetical protein
MKAAEEKETEIENEGLASALAVDREATEAEFFDGTVDDEPEPTEEPSAVEPETKPEKKQRAKKTNTSSTNFNDDGQANFFDGASKE